MRLISPSTLRIMKSPSPISSRLSSVERSVMICSTALEASSIRIPCWITARGSRASTRLMRFCTSTEANAVSVPGTKLAMMSTCPSASLVRLCGLPCHCRIGRRVRFGKQHRPDLVAGRKFLKTLDHDLVAGLQPFGHEPLPVLDRSGAHRLNRDAVVVLDHEHFAAAAAIALDRLLRQ